MFKNDFQGGPCVDVFSIQGKDPLSKVKVSGPQTSVRKEFDKNLKTFIVTIEGEPTSSKITIPKQGKQSLHLTQQYLVFQLYLTAGQAFSLEVSITDHSNNTQRVILSSSSREIVITALHAKMPCSLIEQNVWLNLCLDLGDLISGIFDGSNFVVTDRIVVSANCKLRRIFTLKSKPSGNVDIPKSLQIGDGCSAVQVLDLETFLTNGINIRAGTGNASKRTPHYLNRSNGKPHIAFGSSYQKNLASDDTMLDLSTSSISSTARSNSGTSRSIRTTKSNIADQADTRKVRQDNGEVTIEQSNESKIYHQPRPPAANSAGKVRKPRVKSADYSKEKSNLQLKGQPLSKSADTRGRRKISDTLSDRFTYTRKNSGVALSFSDANNNNSRVSLKPLSGVKLNRRLSQSAMDLEQTEKLIQENRNNHFKSKSLNTLPNIKSNNRYKGTNHTSSDIEDDSVFTDSEGNKQEVLPLSELADDEMVDAYLRRRTASSCHDESSLSITSSCANSTNSDLFVYSSRPRSVVSQRSRQASETETQKGNRPSEGVNKATDEHVVEVEQTEMSKELSSLPSSSGLGSSSLENLPHSSEKTIQDFLKNTKHLDTDSKADVNVTFSANNNPDDTEHDNVDRTFIVTADDNQNRAMSQNKLGQFSNDKNTTQVETENSDSTDALTKSNVKKMDNIFASYKMRESCDSDTMSWLHASSDHSVSEKNVTNKTLKLSPKLALRKQIEERLGSLIVHKDGDTDDGFSDCSDDTSMCEPPAKLRNYRYQDEMQSIGSTLDLAATIPATPQVGDQARFDNDVIDENNNNNNSNQKRVQSLKLHQSRDEELLDLLFDPVLNCYYDPVTHKYYELS